MHELCGTSGYHRPIVLHGSIRVGEAVKLVAKAEWDAVKPYDQGYILYMQEDLPGSELKGLTNPYALGTKENKLFNEGNFQAMLDVQDGEE